jgi:hypothetical protein
MRHTNHDLTQNVAEGRCGEVAPRGESRGARRLYGIEMVHSVYRLEAGVSWMITSTLGHHHRPTGNAGALALRQPPGFADLPDRSWASLTASRGCHEFRPHRQASGSPVNGLR